MSDFRVIAMVTEALRERMRFEADVPFSGADGRSDAPDAIGTVAKPTINVFLYQVTPNTALRNADLPSRDSGGGMMQRPRAALDLHYLISTYGAGFEPQMLLGIVVRTLHSKPFLTRQEINAAALVTKCSFGPEIDSIKFIPSSITLEELSRLWSVFFHTKYALSATYQASVVMIEGTEAATPALPVRAPHIRVVPTLGPVIEKIVSSTPNGPIVAGDTLQIIGQNLRGDGTAVRFGDESFIPVEPGNDLITVVLANPPVPAAALRAGITAVQVVQDIDFGLPSGPRHVFESNVVPFVFAPKITNLTFLAGTPAKIRVVVDPPVVKDQRLALSLTQTPLLPTSRRYSFSTTAATTNATQDIEVDAAAATYLVRLQIDGASSPLEVDAGGAYNGPTVVVT